MAAMASGLFCSMATTPLAAPDIFMAHLRPSATPAAFLSIMQWSLVRKGSHSAPLIIT